jgi:hypothetical protein
MTAGAGRRRLASSIPTQMATRTPRLSQISCLQFPQLASSVLDSVIEGPLWRTKRVVSVVNDNSSHAMRIGVLLQQPFGDQLLDSVVQVKVEVSPNHVLFPRLVTGCISSICAYECKLHFREDRAAHVAAATGMIPGGEMSDRGQLRLDCSRHRPLPSLGRLARQPLLPAKRRLVRHFANSAGTRPKFTRCWAIGYTGGRNGSCRIAGGVGSSYPDTSTPYVGARLVALGLGFSS